MVSFFRFHRGHAFASSALMAPMSRAFVRSIKTFADESGVPVVPFQKNQRKDDVAAEHLARFTGAEGVLFVGKAQEKIPVFRTEKRRNPQTGQSYAWIVRSTATVNHYYFYCVDKDLAHATAETEIPNTPLRKAFDQVESVLDQWIAREKLAA